MAKYSMAMMKKHAALTSNVLCMSPCSLDAMDLGGTGACRLSFMVTDSVIDEIKPLETFE
jgi:hypothetical protein